ncbi:MAG: phosphomannomutase/phosphoglucomutase [Pseudomonadota bacterium]
MAKGKKGAKSNSRVSSASGGGIWSHTVLSFSVAAIGVIVAFALVWWQALLQPAQSIAEQEKQKILGQYAQYFNGRIDEMRKQVNAIATSPAVASALTNFDATRRAELSQQITAQHPYIERVDIIERGRAEVDLNSAVPISFAALDLIRRAESREFVGPEVSLNQQQFVYTAQPVTNQGLVAGVLFVAFNKGFFSDNLAHFEEVGHVKVNQKFDGSASTVIIDWGGTKDLTPPIETALFTPHWTLSVAVSNDALRTNDPTSTLMVPLLVCLAVVAGAIFLGFSRVNRKLEEDAATLGNYAVRIAQGKPVSDQSFNFSNLARVATDLSRFGKAAPQQANKNDATEDEADDLLAGLDDVPPTPKKKQSTDASSDDFLDVRAAADENFGIEVSEEEAPPTMGLNLDHGIFRAYDIRGITTDNLTEEVVYWIGRAFAAQALSEQQSRAAVGWDGRHSSEPLMRSLTRGLTEGGVDVMTIGQVPTPMLYYATYALDTGTGIMITGSHNPPEYNGLKMMIGGVTLAEGAIQRLLQRIEDNDLSEGEGSLEEVDLDDSYIDKICEDVAIAQPLKVVVDCGNGVAGNIAPRLLTELGCEVVPLYCEVDGDFPNHHPDPAEPENMEDLITVVQAEKADLGLAFDGDGDRVGVVTETGEIIWPDKLIMLFAQDIVGRNPGADIIYDVKCSRHLNNMISELGGRPIMWKTGHSHIKAKIKETGALLGGEFSGHICIAERWYGFDDALYSAVRLLEIIALDGRPTSEIFAQFPVTYTTPEIKIQTTETKKFEIMRDLEAQADFGDGTITTIDGLRVDFSDGWGLIRPSNTSPVLSLRFEADGPGALDRIQDEFQAQLQQIAPDLSFK